MPKVFVCKSDTFFFGPPCTIVLIQNRIIRSRNLIDIIIALTRETRGQEILSSFFDQEQETKELLEKARRQHHFDTTEQTCSQTLRNLFPSLRQAVSENLDSTPLTDMLRAKPPQEEKLQLWEKLKVLAFTRCSVLVVSGVYIGEFRHKKSTSS